MLKSHKRERDDFLEQLYRDYADDLNKYIANKVFNSYDREDVFQEVMKYTYKNYKKCINHPNLIAWLYNLSNYVIGKHRRRLELQNRVFSSSIDDQQMHEYEQPFYVNKEFYEDDFDNYKKFLKPKEIELIKLRFVCQYSVREIAEMKNTSYSTMTVKFHRIFKKIRENVIIRQL